MRSREGGKRLEELIDNIEGRIAAQIEAVVKLHENIAATLGRAKLEALNVGFDDALAIASMKMFDLRKIPAIRGALPGSVSEVKFKSHLSGVSEVQANELGLDIAAISILPGERT